VSNGEKIRVGVYSILGCGESIVFPKYMLSAFQDLGCFTLNHVGELIGSMMEVYNHVGDIITMDLCYQG
jgi:hypothetical protein